MQDLIQAAGGAADGADLDRLDLAAVVVDGSRVYVPRVGEAVPPAADAGVGDPAGGGTSQPSAPVDLNTATIEELDALPGIGPATAKAIVDHRTRNGPYRSVEEWWKNKRRIGLARVQIEAIDAMLDFMQNADVRKAKPWHPEAQNVSPAEFEKRQKRTSES